MTTNRIPTELLKREVRELTELLRNDALFANLRHALSVHGLHASDVILAGFVTTDDESEHGVFLTTDLAGIRFELGRNGSVVRWDAVDEPDTLTEFFPAVSVGIAMMRSDECPN